jgi:DNA-binding NtrC family response regulator
LARVLIVDDDPDTVDTFARMLRLEGHDVVTAPDGQQALRQAHTVDVIIADMRMPFCDGLSLVRDMPADHAPVAIVTGDYFLDDETVEELRRLGASVFFKPLWVDDLVDITNRLLSARPVRSTPC